MTFCVLSKWNPYQYNKTHSVWGERHNKKQAKEIERHHVVIEEVKLYAHRWYKLVDRKSQGIYISKYIIKTDSCGKIWVLSKSVVFMHTF